MGRHSLLNVFEEYNWLTTRERRDKAMLKYFFKNLAFPNANSQLQSALGQLFHFRCTPQSDRVVRKERNLQVPRLRTVFAQSSFIFRTVKCWNGPPAYVQNALNFDDFCTKLDDFIVKSRSGSFLLQFK